MALSERQLFNTLNRTPFVDSPELAGIQSEAHATVYHTIADLLAEGIVGFWFHVEFHCRGRFDARGSVPVIE